jgi:hypothetical protein
MSLSKKCQALLCFDAGRFLVPDFLNKLLSLTMPE